MLDRPTDSKDIPSLDFELSPGLFLTPCTLIWIYGRVIYAYPVIRNMSLNDFGEFPWLVGQYCSYLLPKQALATQTEKPNATWQMSG